MKFEFRNFLEKQSRLPKYFQQAVKYETKLVVTETVDLDDEFIEEAICFVESNLEDSEFGINSLMEKFHMSQSSLYKKIKKSTGLSTSCFIRSVRLKNAAKIILETKSQKLSTVALDVGFNDYRYFKKSFKKHFGCLPSEYKGLFYSKLYDRLKSKEIKQLSDESDTILVPAVNLLNFG